MWRKDYKRPNPERDREVRRLRDKQKRIEMRDWFVDYKSHLRCEICGESHLATLEFHHKDPVTKFLEVSVMVSSAPKYSKEKVLEEIDKCLIICSNCHKKLHWEQSQT